MAAMWYRLQADARARWRAWLVLALVVGLAGGSVLALVAGARRTRSAYQRFLVAQDAFDVVVVSGFEGIFDIASLDLERIAALPVVADAAPFFAMGAVARTPEGAAFTADTVNFVFSPDDRFGGTLNRRRLLVGRAADPSRADEVVVSFALAERFNLAVGDVLATNFIDVEEAAATFGSGASTSALPLLESEPLEELRVVGIAAVPGEFPPVTETGQYPPSIFVTAAAHQAHPRNFDVPALAVTLHGGAGAVPAFLTQVRSMVPGPSPVFSISQQEVADEVQGAFDGPAGALALSGALAALVAALLVGQALSRQAELEAGDEPALTSLGLTLRQLVLLRVGKAMVIGVAGAVLAVAAALALSRLFPLGLGAAAEPEPGWRADGLVLGLGGFAVAGATVALVALAALRARRRIRASAPAPAAPTSRLAGAMAGAGFPVVTVAGAHLAIAGARRRSASARSSLATIALGVATVVGTLTFGASLEQLVSSPPLYGWTWDEVLGSEFASNLDATEQAFLAEAPALASVAVGTVVDVAVDGVQLGVTGVDDLRGTIEPALVSGVAPSAADHLVLAPDVLASVDVGQSLDVRLGPRTASFELVGRAVLPLHGGFATLDGLRRLRPGLQPQRALISYTLDADRQAFRAQAIDALALDESDYLEARLPTDLVNFGGANAAPAVTAGLMAVVAIATLVHAVGVATRRRRQDLSVLRVLGFTRRQVLATVGWLAVILVVGALAVALPLGTAAGRLTWLGFAGHLDVVPVAVVPLLATLAVVGAALVLAGLAAVIPAWRAARAQVAVALRTE